VAVVLVAAWGVRMAVADVATSSLLFRLLAAPLLPRVTGAIESAKLALEGLGAFLAPVLVTTIGVRGTLIAAALPLPIVVVSGWKMLRRWTRRQVTGRGCSTCSTAYPVSNRSTWRPSSP